MKSFPSFEAIEAVTKTEIIAPVMVLIENSSLITNFYMLEEQLFLPRADKIYRRAKCGTLAIVLPILFCEVT